MIEWSRVRGLLIDLDGTLFRGHTPIPGALAFMSEVHKIGLPHLYFTNNSTRTPAEVASHLQMLGFGADESQVLTSCLALADVLSDRYGDESRVFVLGEHGLREAVGAYFTVVDVMPPDQCVEIVAVGLDREISYEKLRRATKFLLQGAAFYATNGDRLLPEDDGFAPGAGSIVALLQTACGREAEIVGKPQAEFVRAGCKRLGLAPSEVAVIGDNVDTDVAAGKSAGAHTVLVQTGVSEKANEHLADMSVHSLTELLSLWRHTPPTVDR